MLSEDELKRVLRRVPLIGADGPFHRFVDLWFVHQNLAGGRKTEVLAGLGAKMLGGRFTPRGTFETLYVATSAETVGPGGRQRTEAEFRELLESASFLVKQIVSTATAFRLIEAVPF